MHRCIGRQEAAIDIKHRGETKEEQKLTTETINDYISILREELVPATGCTEPIALAYAAARLRDRFLLA